VRVVVLSGGRSSEHEISLASGAAVREGLAQGGHEVIGVEIGRDGTWGLDGDEVELLPGRGLLGADVVFPVLHGPFGEDGTVQGLLECLDVAYVGAGVLASAVCMDKVVFKELMARSDLPQVAYRGVEHRHWREDPKRVLAELAELGLPVFVKPARLGSSVGIVRVAEADELAAAVEQALGHDERAIVEAAAGGIEVECSVLGRLRCERADGRPEAFASEPGQIVLAGEWYDFDAKYSQSGMGLTVPAPISPAAAERVKELALAAFVHSGCEGLARVDFFIDGEQVLVNELNTMPGFTPTSVYAKLIEASGIAYEELLDRLCRLALERRDALRAYLY
jgi:D-alanine-D-alanine ligase